MSLRFAITQKVNTELSFRNSSPNQKPQKKLLWRRKRLRGRRVDIDQACNNTAFSEDAVGGKRERFDRPCSLPSSSCGRNCICYRDFQVSCMITKRHISAPRAARDYYKTSICSIFSADLYLLLHYSLSVIFLCNFLFCILGDF